MSEIQTKTKSSKQRDLVLRILRGTHCHPTADWIYRQARHEKPDISLGTVYRNLSHLEAEGKIRKLNFVQGTSLYDGDLRDHYHVRCLVCQKVEDVPHMAPRVSCDEVESLTGYEIHMLQLEYAGVCPACQKDRKTDQ